MTVGRGFSDKIVSQVDLRSFESFNLLKNCDKAHLTIGNTVIWHSSIIWLIDESEGKTCFEIWKSKPKCIALLFWGSDILEKIF